MPSAGSTQPGSTQPGSTEPGSTEPGSIQPGSIQPGSIQRRPETSESATQRRSSASTARPEGCANHASSSGPSSRPSFIVPPTWRIVRCSPSNAHRVWLPAIATTNARIGGYQMTSHGEDSRSRSASTAPAAERLPGDDAPSAPGAPSGPGARSGPGATLSAPPTMYCSPVPATVVTRPSASRTPRNAWLTVSATTTSYPRRARWSSGTRHRPFGSLNRACAGSPSTRPRSPDPMRRTSVSPSGASSASE